MSPKERAEELLQTYFKELNSIFGDYVYSKTDDGPKECVLICVNKLINEVKDHWIVINLIVIWLIGQKLKKNWRHYETDNRRSC